MSKGFADNDAATSVEPEHVAEDHGTRSEATKDEHPTIKSLLIEDGVDVSERPISQFCELCRKILRYINDETDLSKSIMEIQHHVNDSDLKDRLQMAVDCVFNSRRVSKKTYTNPRSLLEQSPARGRWVLATHTSSAYCGTSTCLLRHDVSRSCSR
jgi:hypothetical protein